MAAAIASSVRDRPLDADLALIGEIGLSGELRAVAQLPVRLKEATQLGFQRVIVPHSLQRKEAWPEELEVLPVRSLRKALSLALES
jgi:DNA repair protein RadA/Sms